MSKAKQKRATGRCPDLSDGVNILAAIYLSMDTLIIYIVYSEIYVLFLMDGPFPFQRAPRWNPTHQVETQLEQTIL